MAQFKLGETVLVKGKQFTIGKSWRKDKQRVAIGKMYNVHYGDPTMPEYPGTKRGDAYCARSMGIGNINNIRSANFWSRLDLWNCDGRKSK